MSKLGKFAVVAALVLTAAAGSTVAYKTYQAMHKPAMPVVSLSCPVRYELMTKQQTEWLVIHLSRNDCRDRDLQVIHSNGELGVKHLRDNRTLEFESTVSKDGVERRHVTYGDDGKTIVSGFENWMNGTPAWTMTTDPHEGPINTRYWPNGKVFSVEKDGDGIRPAEHWYYYDNGKTWVHYIGPRNLQVSNLAKGAKVLEVWSDTGALTMQYAATDSSTTYTVYRPDGTKAYKQEWSVYSPYYYGGGNIRQVDVYGNDGEHIVRQIHSSPYGGYINDITDLSDDGTKVQYDLQDWNQQARITKITRFDADGKVIESKSGELGKLDFDRSMMKPAEFASPRVKWDDLVNTKIYDLPRQP